MNKNKLQTILGEGTVLSGELISEGIMRIDGKFSGEIYGGIVIIGKNAVVNASIKCEELTIYGKVKGNIQSKQGVEILSEGELIGDIKSCSLTTRKGAHFQGNCELKTNSGDKQGE
ncbi:cell shape determination protein CcmA [Candidatus Desantisbacteria bacterium CG07_land_8_20_14_0_80_39_15]|uniref:Cell shape determination protein CcmA n=1 Tax=Candidatus Desantisbacteria bacterium CG07_land_8_20_14_0_80_39_15 TaxID=1974549 RepID=A0A2M6ZGJ0_9BACT|nr:MAG: cell shape determination protein CcmA [Candidatus Desantisbacteria bacterium CG07_land_8_20_14_0_80_39_15]